MIISPVLISFTRYGSSDENGFTSEAPVSSFSLIAEVQPAKQKEIDTLPENERTKDIIKLYVDSHSYGLVMEGDRFIHNGGEYRVKGIANYSNGLIPHLKLIAVKME